MRLWVADTALRAMRVEADAKAPRETGGMLLGYISRGGAPDDVVIETVIGPGPDAHHYASRFEPDAEWQQQELARTYTDSGRVTTYLGDWHTHPGGSTLPSRRDRRTARAIARSTDARMPNPLMLILASAKGSGWRLAAYRHENGTLTRVPEDSCEVLRLDGT